MIVSVAENPAYYHASIYRRLARSAPGGFRAIFGSPGSARGGFRSSAWSTSIDLGVDILSGYESTILSDRNARLIALVAELKRLQPSGLLVNSHRGGLCTTAIAVGRALGAKIVLRSTPYDSPVANPLREGVRAAYLRAAYAPIDFFAAVGTGARLHFERYTGRPGDIVMSPYCMDEEHIEPARARRASLRARFRQRLRLHDRSVALLVCSRLSEVKRVDWSIRAHATLRAEGIDSRLLIVGDGPLGAELKKVAGAVSDVDWLGFVDRDGVAEAMAGSDILLLPSKSETWGAVVNEAIAFALPTVASAAVNAAVDLIVPGMTGERFPTNDFVAFVDAVRRICVAPTEYHRSDTYERIHERHSAVHAVSGILNAIVGLRAVPAAGSHARS